MKLLVIPYFTTLVTLTNALPTTSQTAPVVCGRQGNPTPRLATYVQTFHDTSNNPLSLLPLRDSMTGVTHIILAALHINQTPGDIHLNDNPVNDPIFDQAWSDVKSLQASGIKAMVMLGGAAPGSYANLAGDDASFQSYYQPLLSNVLRAYNIDGIDLDIEESVDISVPLRLINALYNDMGPNFLISMAPVASALASTTGGDLSGFSYFDLDAQAKSSTGNPLVSFYNAQFYSGFGDPSTPAFYQSIIGAGWDPARVVMGVLTSQNDGNGFVGISSLVSTVQSLKAQYPTFGGVDGWEYFDAGTSDGDSAPFQWVKSLGQAMALPNSKRKSVKYPKVSIHDLPKPNHPFSNEAMSALHAVGAGHFESIRALNRTAGDVEAAKGMVLSLKV